MTTDRAPVVTAEVRQVALPFIKPFVTGFGVTASRQTVLIHLTDADGNEGWGEGPALDHPFYLPDTTATTFGIAADVALPLALEAGDLSPASVAASMGVIRGNTFARSGVEGAFWALQAAAEGRSLQELMGGSGESVPVGESLGIAATVDETLEEVALRLSEGYGRIKLKIRPGWDVEPVRAVREAFGPDVMLQVDANAAYTLADVDTLRRLDDYDLACIEQPLQWDALLEHAQLQRHLATPVCLDETLRSFEDVRRALDIDACRNVNLKPGRVGGLTASLRIAELCRERGIALWCGGMMESGIGRAGNLALCSAAGFTDPADMSPASVLFEWDLVDPTFEVEPDGTIAVPVAPGLGFAVRADRVEAQTIRRSVVLGPAV
ncbi:MAG: menC [Blastococcus sp.]|jgi:O-succinylbenzoate synthase|nr:menC [Blastococcus sp.]